MGATALLNEAEVRPPGTGFLGRLRATGPAGLASAGVIVIATFAAFFGSLLAPYSPVETNLALAWVGPVGGHLLGFDGQGRDVLSRLLAGATTSMLGPLAVVLLAMTAGTLLFAYAMVDLAAVSFIGLGVQAPQSDWGVMVGSGQPGVLQGYPEESLAAGLSIVVVVVAVNLLGERLAQRHQERR